MGSPLGVIATIGGPCIPFSTTSGLGFKTTFKILYRFVFHECLKIHRQNKYSGHAAILL
jgi:hypothetical protein